ncbi:TolC family protein [Deinococcus cavernae]|uniref:TolC family protein n=1 Tax=Deinococcus cavernae TaxID=2320857 RepID=A0A418V040_9DEIO|nr:TolC family protein [Deinococcus cavernae]RJF69092.1 TolC family protein [Deinococcus cavernae]
MNRHALTLTFLASLTLAGTASAQTSLTLPAAVSRALSSNADVVSARATLQKAQANLRAVRADPSSIITTSTQAEQDVSAQAATLDGTKLKTMQAVVGAYLSAYETGQRVALNAAQVALDERNLAIARARLAARVATQLDVNRAQTSLNANRQELADARAQLPVQEAQLARLLGLNAGTDLKLGAPPAAPKLSVTLAALQAGLDKRLPALVQAANGVAFAKLQVSIADNDYTPVRTLEDARTALANAGRGLEDAARASSTGVRDAYRAVQSAQEGLNVAREQAQNAQASLTLARARLKAGTAAPVEVQQAEVQAQQAALAVQQAQDGVWQALAALSVASGLDVTGLVQ